ncbi:unnamed protein product [Owenia fusiformis]|uniref:Reelin domain-containing protein n=1 Tax=Owenia fusiformis TaxID=6347 RepID=A0A8S4PBR5_OWEFU|nr:unnamed protein product [Owenia fusiformis]
MRNIVIYSVMSVILFSNEVTGYTSGAPASQCTMMTPGHYPSTSNDISGTPYTITPSSSTYTPGASMTITLAGSQTYKGFFIQARAPGSDTPLGTFSNPSTSTKLQTCPGGTNNAVTHSDGTTKSTSTMTWAAPGDLTGDVQFITTFVTQYNSIWVKVPSAILTKGTTVATNTTIAPANNATETTESMTDPTGTTATTPTSYGIQVRPSFQLMSGILCAFGALRMAIC